MFTQSQTTLSAPVGANTEMEERIKEPNSEKGENMVSNLQYSEKNVEFGSKMTKVEKKELEIKNVTCQERVVDPQQTDREPKLGSQLGRLLLQDYIPKTTHPVQAFSSPSPYLHIPARPVITQAMPHPPLLFNHGYCQFPLSTFEGDQNFFRATIL